MSQAGSFTSSEFPPGTVVETLTGNTGGPVGPSLSDNINVVGDGTSITVTGDPGTNTLTISALSDVPISFPTDFGTATPSVGVLNIMADTAGLHAGSTISFSGFGDTVLLNVSDVDNNTIVGYNSGNLSMSGAFNTVLGTSCMLDITSGSSNMLIGAGSGGGITSGSYNTCIGSATGIAYTSSESSNVCIGYGTTGSTSESNVLRIGNGTGTGIDQLSKCFISGVDGVNVGSTATVVTENGNQLGTAVITAGTGITITPGANTITIDATSSGDITSIATDSGTATPSAGVINIIADNVDLNCGSSVLFDASGSTVLLNVTDTSLNTVIGKFSGSSSLTGTRNIIYGSNAASSLANGSGNVVCGESALSSLVSGSSNIAIGFRSAQNYSTNESNNINIGSNTFGTVGESNTLRIGNGITQCFIAGIDGVDVGSVATVVTESGGQLGTAVITAGTGITITPGSNTITIDATSSGDITSIATDSGTATPSAGVINIIANGGTNNSGSSVLFTGSSDNVELNVTDSNSNTIIGSASGNGSITGTNNTILGKGSGTSLTSGISNTIMGEGSATGITTGGSNIVIGKAAGTSITTSDSTNTLIGHAGFATAADFIAITAGNAGPLMFHNFPGTNSNTGNGGNLFVGQSAGNLTLTGATIFNNNGIGQNTLSSLTTGHLNNGLGYGTLTALTTGNRNNSLGHEAGFQLVSGSYNVLLGNLSGSNYTTSESSNIQINNTGTISESNVLRIGAGTGSGNQQLNKAYISGIAGVNVGSVATIVTEASDQLGTAVITAGTGITVTPGANTITIATTALTSAITSITGDTGGAQTGPAITFAGGTTGLSFGGATNTLTTTFAGITANGGTVSLATDATTSTVNVGTGAGIKTVTLGSTNSSSVTAVKYGTGNFSLASGTGTIISALAAGEVTMPHQPAFYAFLQNTTSNVTGDGTFYQVVFDTLVYDQGSNFNLSGTPSQFTAPVTGKYHFCLGLGYMGLTSLDTDGRIILITSAQEFQMYRNNFGAIQTSGIVIGGFSVYAPMTAGDTAYVETYVGVSTKTVSLFGDVNCLSFFSGVLAV